MTSAFGMYSFAIEKDAMVANEHYIGLLVHLARKLYDNFHDIDALKLTKMRLNQSTTSIGKYLISALVKKRK